MPAKKQVPQTVDDGREVASYIAPYNMPDAIPELQALIDSHVLILDGTIATWREGHLEHIAAQYIADRARCEAIYHDDVTVARAYSREQWEALIGG